MEKRKQEEEEKQVIKELNAQEDESKRILDLKEEVEKLRKRVERQDKEDAEKKKGRGKKVRAEEEIKSDIDWKKTVILVRICELYVF